MSAEDEVEYEIPATDGLGRPTTIKVLKNWTEDGDFCPRCDISHFGPCLDKNLHDFRVGKRRMNIFEKADIKDILASCEKITGQINYSFINDKYPKSVCVVLHQIKNLTPEHTKLLENTKYEAVPYGDDSLLLIFKEV